MRLIVLSKTHARVDTGRSLGETGQRRTCALYYLPDNDVFSGPSSKRG